MQSESEEITVVEWCLILIHRFLSITFQVIYVLCWVILCLVIVSTIITNVTGTPPGL